MNITELKAALEYANSKLLNLNGAVDNDILLQKELDQWKVTASKIQQELETKIIKEFGTTEHQELLFS